MSILEIESMRSLYRILENEMKGKFTIDWLKFYSMSQLVTLGKGHTLNIYGLTAEKLWFIYKGKITAKTITKRGTISSIYHYTDNQLMGSLVSLISKTPSYVWYETETPCILLEFDFEELKREIHHSLEFSQLYIHLIEKAFVEKKLKL